MSPTDEPLLVPPPRWVISDTHLGHENILTYCPWRQTWAATVEEHDAALVEGWCATVGADDWVLHLGDFSLGPRERVIDLRRRLPGKIILVRGNHDRSLASLREAGFDIVCSAARIDGDHAHWIARHNPAAFSTREAAVAQRLLHGHCHGNGIDPSIHPAVRAKAVDCSLDARRSIAPVPWDAVR